jgi:ABC-type transport system involved in multi-copper enzyme maturation permease subunit
MAGSLELAAPAPPRPARDLQLIGPHAYYDLVRMARQGRTILFRTVFIAALAAVFTAVWFSYQRHSGAGLGGVRNRIAAFNADCVYTFFVLQNLAILTLAPVYFGGAIAHERESGTLEPLFTSALRDREIVLGMFAARVLHVGGLLLAGTPVLFLMLSQGGIEASQLLQNELNSGMLLFAVGSLCLMVSTLLRSAARCVLICHGIVLVPCLGCGFCLKGFPLVIDLKTRFTGAGPLALALAGIAALYAAILVPCLLVSIHALRPHELSPISARRERAARKPPRRDAELPVFIAPLSAYEIDFVGSRALPPVEDNALLWKERHLGRRCILLIPVWGFSFTVVSGWLLLPVLLLSLVQAARLNPMEGTLLVIPQGLGYALDAMFVLFLACFAIGVAFRAAGSVVCEKQGKTLDPLLLLPVSRRGILSAKWMGAALKGWPWIWLMSGTVLLGVATTTIHPSCAFLLLLTAVSVVCCVCSAGVLVSLLVATRLQANLVTALGLLGVGMIAGTSHCGGALVRCLWLSWWGVTAMALPDIASVMAAAVSLLVGSWLLWQLTCELFERTGRGRTAKDAQATWPVIKDDTTTSSSNFGRMCSALGALVRCCRSLCERQ